MLQIRSQRKHRSSSPGRIFVSSEDMELTLAVAGLCPSGTLVVDAAPVKPEQEGRKHSLMVGPSAADVVPPRAEASRRFCELSNVDIAETAVILQLMHEAEAEPESPDEDVSEARAAPSFTPFTDGDGVRTQAGVPCWWTTAGVTGFAGTQPCGECARRDLRTYPIHRHGMAAQAAATALQRYRNILFSSIFQPLNEDTSTEACC